MIDNLLTAISDGNNQYTRPYGNAKLVEKIAESYAKYFSGRKLNPLTEIVVGHGAYNVIYAIL